MSNPTQIHELHQLLQAKDRKIISLQNQLALQESELSKLRQELKNKDTLIRSYNHNLYSKNVEMSKMEAKFQGELEGLIGKKNAELDQLKLIITSQEQQITQLMNDHTTMLTTLQQIDQIHKALNEQKSLLAAFNAELQSQITEVEDQNERIIVELEQTRKELELQNMQGEDLMAQMQAMAGHIGIPVQ